MTTHNSDEQQWESLQKAIDSQLGKDPRTNPDALQHVFNLFPRKQNVEDGSHAENDVLQEELAALELDSHFEEPKTVPSPSQPQPQPQPKESWPAELPKTITGETDIVKVLDFYALTEDQMIVFLLGRQKSPSTQVKKALWESELALEGITEAEVSAAIEEFLFNGKLTKEFSKNNSRIKYTLETRSAWQDRFVEHQYSRILKSSEGYVTESMEQKTKFFWKLACSLTAFVAPGAGKDKGPVKGNATEQEVITNSEILDKVPSIIFDMMASDLYKMDRLMFLASQKIAIENF